MIKTKDEKKQTFLYRRKEYKFRIMSASLRKMEKETGKRAEEIILGSSEDRYMILFYCTCWKEDSVTLERFIDDCKSGAVMFRPGAREYSRIGLHRLFASKIREFKNNGEL